MTSQLPSKTVAIIGGGISGLVCGVRLQQLGIRDVTVFDTGKNAAGGRCSSRNIVIGGQSHVFDHSAQYFTVSDPRFSKIVSFLHGKGAVKVWTGPVGHLKNQHFEKDRTLTQAFVGKNGMQSIPECLAMSVKIQRPVWVGNVFWEESVKKWKVDRFGFYDYLVVAHNGKCADRLMSNAGVPQIHRLLQVRFCDRLIVKDKRMQLCSIFALLVAFPSRLVLTYEGAHVTDPDVSWIANNSAKLANTSANSGVVQQHQCWTIFSTRQFGSSNKVPQENIPPSVEKEITKKLLSAFSRVTGLKELPPPSYTRLQLWGAAVPMNVLQSTEECVFDGMHQVGICGDWLVSPCIQGAAVSGLALAERIYKHSCGDRHCSTRLDPVFKPADGEMIGAFPTSPNMVFKPSVS